MKEQNLKDRNLTLISRIIRQICNVKETQKSKMAVWGGLTNSCEKKRSKKQRRKDISI